MSSKSQSRAFRETSYAAILGRFPFGVFIPGSVLNYGGCRPFHCLDGLPATRSRKGKSMVIIINIITIANMANICHTCADETIFSIRVSGQDRCLPGQTALGGLQGLPYVKQRSDRFLQEFGAPQNSSSPQLGTNACSESCPKKEEPSQQHKRIRFCDPRLNHSLRNCF